MPKCARLNQICSLSCLTTTEQSYPRLGKSDIQENAHALPIMYETYSNATLKKIL